MKKDFIACNALIFNEDRDLIASVKVLDYDSYENSIIIKSLPALDRIKRCELIILTSPIPYMYRGTIHKTAINKAESGKRIRLFNEHITEYRQDPRYKINSSTSIDELIYDGKAYRLHTQLEIHLLDISKRGVRFRSAPDSFAVGNRFYVRIITGDESTILFVEVVNTFTKAREYSEYGCRLIDEDGD